MPSRSQKTGAKDSSRERILARALPPRAPLARVLLETSPAEAERIFNRLPLFEQVEVVLTAPWEIRQKLILLSERAPELVQKLPPQELFWTIKAIGPEDALSLLALATPEQMAFIFDLDWWRKDSLVPERILSWLIILFEVSEDKVAQWLVSVDEDLLAAVMHLFIRVNKRPDDTDFMEARDRLPPFTLDDTYFIAFRKKKLEPIFMRLLQILIEVSPERYRNLMETLLWELPAEVQERAYRWRKGRLGDLGVPDYFEALDIYARLESPKQMRPVERRYLPEPTEDLPPPAFLPVVYMGEGLFTQALSRITDPAQFERLRRELAWVVNKILMTDEINLDDPSQVKRAIEKAESYFNLALEVLSGKNPEEARACLEEYLLEDLFRLAHTKLRGLRRQALALFEDEPLAEALSFLDEPYKLTLEGLLQERPQDIFYFDQKAQGTDQEFRFFQNLTEVKEVAGRLKEIELFGRLLPRIFGPPRGWPGKCLLAPTNITETEDLVWSGLLATALANWLLKGAFVFEPLTRREWSAFLKRLLEPAREGERARIPPQIRQEVERNFKALIDPVEEETLTRFLDYFFGRLEDEFAYVDPSSPPDPRYITLVVVRLGEDG
ncbi:hypothetical protein G4V39_09220 [Thermosulfuriphilus ammonigenes]|uniref:Uncharacterized protein n=1 Tax=Thermosulfuriphilus ammonigenes TaxID=1936021 RepID=A0A6G7PXM2_9BACT|nr:DUF6178 family protein [Thermosulfuriphilus ammonigenes]MBA2849364.1 hypothetical protein [Thermosulfuriphilus ammonigenes]QIJ72439.1 hypothetical protein G4V39_09220 [Thermosulfuriphilus ammonigenes]